MPAVGLSQSDFERVFGPSLEAREPGRSQRCNTCGGWHRLDQPWPHNCREPQPPRNPDLATPQIAPAFVPFLAAPIPGAEVIASRNDKREYMERNDLVEYDAGVKQERAPTEREEKAVFAKQIKRFVETDPLAIEPVERIGETNLDEAPEIETDGMEIFDD